MTDPVDDEINATLRQTLEDRRLSRGERKALRAVIDESTHLRDHLARWRRSAFEVARATLPSTRTPTEAQAIVDWLEEVVKLTVLQPVSNASEQVENRIAEVAFSPGAQCRTKIALLLREARDTADICVFTITDDHLAAAILEAHRRGVRVRIVTDGQKSLDHGSDIIRLGHAGIPVRTDRSDHHMHHKFAVFDGRTVATGSYNWTRSAAELNRENVVISDDRRIVDRFIESFEQLWADLD